MGCRGEGMGGMLHHRQNVHCRHHRHWRWGMLLLYRGASGHKQSCDVFAATYSHWAVRT